MPSIRQEILIPSDPSTVWDAVRDFGAIHRRLVAGFVVDARVEGEAGDERVVTFANGAVARERLVALDDEHRRLVYSVVESSLGFTHHQASVEVLDDTGTEGRGTRLLWISDVLPDELGPVVDALMIAGAAAITETLSA